MDTTTLLDCSIQAADRLMLSATKLRNRLNHLKEAKSQPSLSMGTIMWLIFSLTETCTLLDCQGYRRKQSSAERRALGWRFAGRLSDAVRKETGMGARAQFRSSNSMP